LPGGYFFQLPIAPQVRYLFEHCGLAEALTDRDACPSDNITDVVDGSKYKRVKSTLSGKYDLILMWNTDGISLQGSSHKTL